MTDDPVRLDAPNQQTVRPDGSHPADEGAGAGKPAKAKSEKPEKASASSSAKRASSESNPPAGSSEG